MLAVAQNSIIEEDAFAKQRQHMVDLIESRGVQDSLTLLAMNAVSRHAFVPEKWRDHLLTRLFLQFC